MMTTSQLDEIIEAFEKWFIKSPHSKIEDYYADKITYERISKLSQQEFGDFFLEFAKEGGKIQTGGARTAGRLIKNIHDNFTEFKNKILLPFQSNFNITEWLKWTESFTYLGRGLATIYLNRVDKTKYVIVNDKSIKAYKELGYDVVAYPLERTYNDLLHAQTDIRQKYSTLSNFFKTDALTEFLIGQDEGRELLNRIKKLNAKIKPITKESAIKAIERIDNNPDIRNHRESIEYDLVYNSRKYPPILVLSEANKIEGGQGLLLKDFGNSTKSAFSILETLGFKIEKKKIDFSSQLQKFIDQSEKGGLSTNEYIGSFEDLKVKVGFGKGNEARIPWIAFLSKDNTVQNGIYPVYLYYKSKKILILAYGVSETNTPSTNWDLVNPIYISTFFEENKLGRPERYGSSFVYKTYKDIKRLSPEEINRDLCQLIDIYKQKIDHRPTIGPVKQIDFNYNSFKESLDTANLLFDKKLIIRFISSLVTKPFAILTGLSGSGKTKLAQAFAKWLCQYESQYCIVPVGADWTNREPLLGYPNALKSGRVCKAR